MTAQTLYSALRCSAVRTLLGSLVFAGSTANAHSPGVTKTASVMWAPASVTVSYGDLNLATPEGNRTLYRRIVAAAEKVCPEPTGSRLSGNQRCREQAIARAVSDTKSEQLAELQAARGRGQVGS